MKKNERGNLLVCCQILWVQVYLEVCSQVKVLFEQTKEQTQQVEGDKE